MVLKLYNVCPEAEHYAREIVWLHGVVGLFIWPLSFTLPNALRAAGDTAFTMIASTISMWVIRVGVGIAMGRYWGFGVVGIWIAMMADWAVRAVLFIPRFRGHKWEMMGIKE